METSVTVTSKEELEKAINDKCHEIIVKGELAEKVHRGKVVTTLGPLALIALGVAIAAIPFTGGTSLIAFSAAHGAAALTGAAAFTGMEIATIAAVCFIGLAVLIALFKDYEEVNFKASAGEHSAELQLRRKQS